MICADASRFYLARLTFPDIGRDALLLTASARLRLT
jgi:hypothetical protein